MKIFKGEAGL